MNQTITNSQTIAQYTVQSLTDDTGKLYAKLVNNNAKDYNATKAYYVFRDEERRDNYIKETVANIQNRVDNKAKRKAERLSFVNPAKLGDVLYSSWGYDQTRCDFYQVTKVTAKGVYIRQISKQHVGNGGFDNWSVRPVIDSFVKETTPKFHTVGRGFSREEGYCVTIASYANAYLTDPNKDHSESGNH